MGGLVDARPSGGPSPTTSTSRPANLVTPDSPGQGAVTITSTAPGQQRQQRRRPARGGGLEANVRTGPVDANLGNNLIDSFFNQSAWTREDVLVATAMVQLVAWGILLYHEVLDS